MFSDKKNLGKHLMTNKCNINREQSKLQYVRVSKSNCDHKEYQS